MIPFVQVFHIVVSYDIKAVCKGFGNILPKVLKTIILGILLVA